MKILVFVIELFGSIYFACVGVGGMFANNFIIGVSNLLLFGAFFYEVILKVGKMIEEEGGEIDDKNN